MFLLFDTGGHHGTQAPRWELSYQGSSLPIATVMVIQSGTIFKGQWAQAPGCVSCLTQGDPCQFLLSWYSNLAPLSRVFSLDVESISPIYYQYCKTGLALVKQLIMFSYILQALRLICNLNTNITSIISIVAHLIAAIFPSIGHVYSIYSPGSREQPNTTLYLLDIKGFSPFLVWIILKFSIYMT